MGVLPYDSSAAVIAREMVVGRGEPVLLDVPYRGERLLRRTGQSPGRHKRTRFEEACDGLGLEKPCASHTHRRLLSCLLDPQSDRVFERAAFAHRRGTVVAIRASSSMMPEAERAETVNDVGRQKSW